MSWIFCASAEITDFFKPKLLQTVIALEDKRRLQKTIKAFIRTGEQFGYVAECMEIPVVTQGETLDETTSNLQEAVQLHLDGEDLAKLGLAPNPTILVNPL